MSLPDDAVRADDSLAEIAEVVQISCAAAIGATTLATLLSETVSTDMREAIFAPIALAT